MFNVLDLRGPWTRRRRRFAFLSLSLVGAAIGLSLVASYGAYWRVTSRLRTELQDEDRLLVRALDELIELERGESARELPTAHLRHLWADLNDRPARYAALLDEEGRLVFATRSDFGASTLAEAIPTLPVATAWSGEVEIPGMGRQWMTLVPGSAPRSTWLVGMAPDVLRQEWLEWLNTAFPMVALANVVLLPLGLLILYRTQVRALAREEASRRTLEKSEAKYQLITEGSADLITEHEVDTGVMRYVSPASHQFGYAPEELEGRPILEVVHPKDRARAAENLSRLSLSTDPLTMEFRMLLEEGFAWVEVTARRIEHQEPVIVATTRDITQRREDEEENQKLQAQLKRAATEWTATFDTIDSPILVLDSPGRIRRLNVAAAALMGQKPEEAVGTSLADLSGDFWRALDLLLREAAGTGREARAADHPEEQGRTWSLRVSPTPVSTPSGQWYVAIATDITDLFELRESLRKRETLAAVGSLVANVSHEVRNYLFSIGGLLEVIQRRFGDTAELQVYVESLQGEVGRLKKLMGGLLEYGRPGDLERAPERPSTLAREALQTVASQASAKGIQLTFQGSNGNLELSVDRLRLVQVLVNVLDNAIAHSPAGSEVTVEVQDLTQRDLPYIRFSVQDQGPGIPPEDLPRIFEPFFSRRPGGTGLGLAIVHRLVDLHGGEIQVKNRADGGADVQILLPVRSEAAGSGARTASFDELKDLGSKDG